MDSHVLLKTGIALKNASLGDFVVLGISQLRLPNLFGMLLYIWNAEDNYNTMLSICGSQDI